MVRSTDRRCILSCSASIPTRYAGSATSTNGCGRRGKPSGAGRGSFNDSRGCSRTGNGLPLRQLSGDQDDRSPVTGDGYAGICGSPGLKCPGLPDRPGRSALQAVERCRERCWRRDWVIDLDVQKFFDSVRWDLIVKAVQAHTDAPWVLLYVKRWLAAP